MEENDIRVEGVDSLPTRNRGGKYGKVLDEFVSSKTFGFRVSVVGRSPKTVYIGLRLAARRNEKYKDVAVRLVNKEVYLVRR